MKPQNRIPFSPVPASGGSPLPAPSGKQRILVADDYDSARDLISNALTCAGYQVDIACNGQEAWEMIQTKAYDLLITDNEMPRLNGLELIKRVRQADINLPVILVSGQIFDENEGDHARLKIAAVVSKPFAFWDFMKTVSHVLQEKNAPTGPLPLARPAAGVAGSHPAHILIADDDPTVRGSLAAVLESEGYVVHEAGNGIEAVTCALRHEPRLVLLDLNMPHADGWTAFNQLDRVTPLLPVIVITARPNQYEEAVRVGVDAFMEKPLNIPLLVRAIKRLTTEDEDIHVSRITSRGFVTQLLSSADAGRSTR